MGRKVHPYGFRLGGIKDWKSRWFADRRSYKRLLAEDIEVRNLVMKQVAGASVSDVEIDR